MKKRLLAVTGIAATVLAIGGFGGMASANTLPGGAVAAVVTGTVAINTCTPGSGPYTAQFNQVQIAGSFVDANAHAWAGAVGLPSGIQANGNSIVATPAGPCVPIVAAGALGAGTAFNGTSVLGTVNGQVDNGTFVQLGSVAVAAISLSYCVNSALPVVGNTGCTFDPSVVTSGAVAVITVVPETGVGCAVGTVCETAIGPVVGGPVALPPL